MNVEGFFTDSNYYTLDFIVSLQIVIYSLLVYMIIITCIHY